MRCGQIADLVGLNVVGLRRRGATRADLHRLRDAYRALFLGEGVFAERIDAVARDFADDPLVAKSLRSFAPAASAPLMQPRSDGGDERGDDAA